MMTSLEIENHNQICAELTAGDGIPRLTWELQVAAYDSATPGTVVAKHKPLRYSAGQLRPWPGA
jgi:hypothetical protein